MSAVTERCLGWNSEGSDLALQAAAHIVSTGGQGVHDSRSGWFMSAHHGGAAGVPGLPAQRAG